MCMSKAWTIEKNNVGGCTKTKFKSNRWVDFMRKGIFSLLVVLEFQLKALPILVRCLTALAMPYLQPLGFSCFSD
jgi:hypothetical protein